MGGDEKGGQARRPRVIERPRVSPGPLADLKALMYELYLEAGAPSLDEIAAWVAEDDGLAGAPERDTIHRIIRDTGVPASQADVVAVVTVLARAARWDRHDAARRARGLWVAARMGSAAGVPLTRVTDPFALEVHRPVQPDDPQPELPMLPVYVPREHDTELEQVVRAAAEGISGIAVLVGGSSTGKTRACWEALRLLRDRPEQWRLWHPIDPTRPDAALRELPAIGPRTVVWLNEAQFYLDAADGGLGERVAAGLRELLRDPVRVPVLVLATMWSRFWDALTARPEGGADPHAQARELLASHDIAVPAAFTAAQLQRLSQATDVRLTQAAAAAQDGQVIQFLAGAPELLTRYRNAPPAAKALIHTAMDARRLGMGIGLPYAFLEAAAPGYLTDAEWDALGEDWLEQALAYTAVPCKGVRGPLTRIRPRPGRSRPPGLGSRDNDKQPAQSAASITGASLYRLADYLEQHGRNHRDSEFPPAGFWAAAADHAFPGDQAVLGDAAHARGLYRAAAQLFKNAAACGDSRAGVSLINSLISSDDHRPAQWVVTHVSLDDAYAVAQLLDGLRKAGAAEQLTALLHRDPAAHVSLDHPHAVTELLRSLRKAGAQEQLTALLHRDPAAHVSLDNLFAVASLLKGLREASAHEQVTALADRAADVPLPLPLDGLREAGPHEQLTALADYPPVNPPYSVVVLLRSLQEAGAQEQLTALADRAIARVSLDNPGDVAWLLDGLREAGAHEQVTALLHRDPAAHALLDNPYGVAEVLRSLRKAGAQEQVTALLHRDPAAHALLDNLSDVAWLLDALREAGAHEQVIALADRAAAHVPLDAPIRLAELLRSLREAGVEEQITALLHRDPAARVSLDIPVAVAALLYELREAGAQEQLTALADRAAAHASLGDPVSADALVGALREAGAQEQLTALADRLPSAGTFELFCKVTGRFDKFRFGREPDGRPAECWGWGDLE